MIIDSIACSPLLKTWKWKVLIAQLCQIVCNPMDCSPPGSTVHGILQARILEWIALPFSKGSFWPRDQTQVSCIAGIFSTVWATGEAHWSLGPEEPLEKGMATHSSILAWKVPRTEKPGGLQSMGSQRVGQVTMIEQFTQLLFKAWKWVKFYSTKKSLLNITTFSALYEIEKERK